MHVYGFVVKQEGLQRLAKNIRIIRRTRGLVVEARGVELGFWCGIHREQTGCRKSCEQCVNAGDGNIGTPSGARICEREWLLFGEHSG